MNSTNVDGNTTPNSDNAAVSRMSNPCSATVRAQEVKSICCSAPLLDYPEDDICPKCLTHSHPE